MGFMDGLNGFGAGISLLADNALKDQVRRAPLLDSAPAAPSAPTAATPPATSAPSAATASGKAAGVPAALLPYYEAAAKRTGIPIDILIAQGKQESGFRVDAVGSAGEIGVHQIKPSTARDPGFGMRGIDPDTLRDPAVNIAFGADYLRARAGQGVDWNDPRAVDEALRRYNGGGDKNYAANVRQYIGRA